MATIIDSLIVTIGLDNSGLKKGTQETEKSLKKIKDNAKETGKSLSKSNKESARSFGELGVEALKFFGVIGSAVALKSFITNQINASAATSRFSKNIGANANDVRIWSGAAEMAGGSAEGLASTLEGITKAQAEIKWTGTTGTIPFFAALGVSLSEINGKAIPAIKVLNEVRLKLNSFNSRAEAFQFGKMHGIDEGTLNLLLLSNKEFDTLISNSETFNKVSDLSGDAAERLASRIKMSGQVFNKVWGEGLIILESLMQGFDKIGAILGNETFDLINNPKKYLNDVGGNIVSNSKSIYGSVKNLYNDIFGKDSLKKETKNQNIAQSSVQSAPQNTSKSQISSDSGMLSFFVNKGWTPAQAAGIVSNLKSESQLNPNAVGDSGKAKGIAQWHPDRQANFKKLFGKSIEQSTLQEQAEFVNHELTKGSEKNAGDRLKNAASASDAGSIISKYYERPKDDDGKKADQRSKLANMLYSGMPGVSSMAANSVNGKNSTGSVTNKSVESNIGEIKIYTAATDAQGIANSIKPAMNYLLVGQADYGLD
jgi:hypothetical protein